MVVTENGHGLMAVPYAEVIGDPIAHSKSPLIHEFWLKRLGLEGAYRSVLVTPDTLPAYLSGRRRDPAWRGCNVTMPLKTVVQPFLASIERHASLVGAVNTIVHGSGTHLAGYNTDIAGVASPLMGMDRSTYPNHVATYVQIIGAGGAARAAMRGAVEAGYADFDVFNRSIEKAREFAALAGAPAGMGHPLDALGPIRNEGDGPEDQRYSHVIINATCMGMTGNPPVPIDLSDYHADTIVFDMVYEPVQTPLLAQARALGLRTIDGLQMLVAQAASAFELFFGLPAPRQHDAELRELLTR